MGRKNISYSLFRGDTEENYTKSQPLFPNLLADTLTEASRIRSRLDLHRIQVVMCSYRYAESIQKGLRPETSYNSGSAI